jgi:hypothetical protein
MDIGFRIVMSWRASEGERDLDDIIDQTLETLFGNVRNRNITFTHDTSEWDEYDMFHVEDMYEEDDDDWDEACVEREDYEHVSEVWDNDGIQVR